MLNKILSITDYLQSDKVHKPLSFFLVDFFNIFLCAHVLISFFSSSMFHRYSLQNLLVRYSGVRITRARFPILRTNSFDRKRREPLAVAEAGRPKANNRWWCLWCSNNFLFFLLLLPHLQPFFCFRGSRFRTGGARRYSEKFIED